MTPPFMTAIDPLKLQIVEQQKLIVQLLGWLKPTLPDSTVLCLAKGTEMSATEIRQLDELLNLAKQARTQEQSPQFVDLSAGDVQPGDQVRFHDQGTWYDVVSVGELVRVEPTPSRGVPWVKRTDIKAARRLVTPEPPVIPPPAKEELPTIDIQDIRPGHQIRVKGSGKDDWMTVTNRNVIIEVHGQPYSEAQIIEARDPRSKNTTIKPTEPIKESDRFHGIDRNDIQVGDQISTTSSSIWMTVQEKGINLMGHVVFTVNDGIATFTISPEEIIAVRRKI